MDDPLGSSARVNSQKQNHEGVVGAQSGQYRDSMESSLGRDVTISIWICFDRNYGNLQRLVYQLIQI